jgi:hypothetical protein
MADADSTALTSRLIEVDDIVQLGTTPGETHGYECAACQAVSGLQWGNAEDARRALETHRADDHRMP